jgi:hypothetical protein
MRYSKGICWLDDCRIPFVDDTEDTTRGKYENKVQVGIMAERPNIKFVGSFDDSAKQGRFTPNLLVCDDMLNDGSVSKTNTSIIKPSNNSNSNILGGGKGIPPTKERIQNGDKGTNSRYYDLDKWFDKIIEKL